MSKSKRTAQNLFEVANPCSQNWDEMRGSDKVRFCEHCASEINNLSAMRRKKAMRMVRDRKGKTALGIALENDYKEIAELLIAFGAKE